MTAPLAAIDWCGLLRDLGVEILGGAVAGAVLLAGGYWLIDRKVHLRDALTRQADREKREAANRRGALTVMYEEMLSNAGSRLRAIAALKKGEISYPLFDLKSLDLAFEPAIFEVLKTDTVLALLQIHNRMRTANEQHAA